MSSQSSTSSLESLNESSTTKYTAFWAIHAQPTISNKNNICYDTSARYVQMIASDEELNTRIGNTNCCICGN